MRCPHCGYRDSKVTDSRSSGDGIRRRRECGACGERFTTVEAVQLSSVQIVKKDGRRECFNAEKLLSGLRNACAKRNVSVRQLNDVASDIEARVTSDGRSEIPSTFIGELAMEALQRLDHIAYIRFASVYRSFADLEALQAALDALQDGHFPDEPRDSSHQLPLLDSANETCPPSSPRPVRIMESVG